MDAPPVQYVKTSDGYDIAYAVSGEGRPFVLMPNLSAWNTEQLWRHPTFGAGFGALASRFHLIQYDARGTGNSTRGLKPDHSYEGYILDLEAVVQRLGLEDFVIEAQITGAHAALRYLTRHPGQVAGLILRSPMPVAGAVGLKNWEGVYTNQWEAYLRHGLSIFWPGDVEDWVKFYGENTSQANFILASQTIINSHVEEILPLISTPVLVITPRNMPNPPFLDNSRAYASLITNSQLILYDHDFWDILSTGGPGKPSALSIIEGFVAGLPPAGNRPTAPPTTAALPDGLSERELQVLRLLASGKSNPEIAKELFITRNTVQNHVGSILIKTNLTNRAQAAVYARDHGIG